jgi:hypothetical protein
MFIYFLGGRPKQTAVTLQTRPDRTTNSKLEKHIPVGFDGDCPVSFRVLWHGCHLITWHDGRD